MTKRPLSRHRHVLLVLATLLFTPAFSAVADDGFAAKKSRYEMLRMRASLYKHTEAWRALVHGADSRAIPILARDYNKVRQDREASQHVMVTAAFAQDWEKKDALEAIEAWRAANTDDADAWLWYRSLLQRTRLKDRESARVAETSAPSLILQLAALRAMAEGRDEAAIEASTRRLAAFKDRAAAWRGDQPLVLECIGRCLASLKHKKDDEAWREVARTAVEYMAHKQVPRRTKYVLARCMAKVFGGDPTDLSAENWVREILAGGSGASGEDARYGGPSFGGLRAAGDRIVYVIDFSDSMLTPIDPALKKKLSAVITGGRDAKSGRDRPLPWHKINTRFDLARELLKASLEGLDKSRYFAVVWFGTDTGTLEATPKLVKASSKKIKAAIKELDSIRPGPVGTYTQFEHGSLKGETNLHGGLRRAFRLTARKPLPEGAYVLPAAREDGAETIFLLSDGVPTRDDWTKMDKADGERAVVDRESGKPAESRAEMRFPGPYGAWPAGFIPQDLKRRNLLRHVELHCLGLGEARMRLLTRIADAGLGKATKIGGK